MALDVGIEAGSVAEVERELAQLRRRHTPRSREGFTAPARASVLNAVVYATRRAHAERAAQTIADLAERHPCRAIVLYHDTGEREAFRAELTLQCHLLETRREVCYEQIVVRARSDAGHRLRSVLIPLLVPDLPVFVWWTGTPPIGAPQFDGLVELADRLIVDSADFVRPVDTLPQLSMLVGDATYGITDLNWTRLTSWRELLAQFFDVPEWRPFLNAVTGVRVGFAVDMEGREIHPSQALLLLGWLGAGLGWRARERLAPSEAGGHLFTVGRADGAPIQVRLRPRFLRGLAEGHVTGVRLLAQRDGHDAEFVVKRAEDGSPHATTEVIVDGSSVLRRTVLLPMPTVVELLGEEFTISRGDETYEDALGTLVAFT